MNRTMQDTTRCGVHGAGPVRARPVAATELLCPAAFSCSSSALCKG